MRRFITEAPEGQEEFLYFVLACHDSVESVVNCAPQNRKHKFLSSKELADWTMQNWNWAVEGAVASSQHVSILYSHYRILNNEFVTDNHFTVAHFDRHLPIYDFFCDSQHHYQAL